MVDILPFTSHKSPKMLSSKSILLFLALFVDTSTSNAILSSPILTNRGEWGTMDRCPEGTFVMGMRLKTEPFQGPLDDTSLNGVQLLCGNADETRSREVHRSRIQSKVGRWGTWGNFYECPNSYAIGFQLRSEKDQHSKDDTGANNLRLFCSNGKGFLEGAGLPFGEWTSVQLCPWRSVLCGLQTQVETSQGSNADDTSLNNLRAECCEYR